MIPINDIFIGWYKSPHVMVRHNSGINLRNLCRTTSICSCTALYFHGQFLFSKKKLTQYSTALSVSQCVTHSIVQRPPTIYCSVSVIRPTLSKMKKMLILGRNP